MQNLAWIFKLLLGLLFSVNALAVKIPTNLSKSDLQEVVTTLGQNTSTKFLSNPYPLGGFSGLEISLSIEAINTSEISRLGDTTDEVSELLFPRIHVGKGLYNNMDLYVHFVPFSKNSDVSEYGGLFKWSFYQAKFLPISISVLLHANKINFGDVFNNTTLGSELLIGINVDDFALYFGGGQLQSNGEFLGNIVDQGPGTGIIVNSNNTAKEIVRELHSFVGIHFNYSTAFIALQIDRYLEPVYSAKVGLRF